MNLTDEMTAYKQWCELTGRNPGRAESLDAYMAVKEGKGDRR